MALTAQLMPIGVVEDISVVQLGTALAYLGEGAAHSSAEVALRMAQKLGSPDRLVLIPVPTFLDDETIQDALLRDTGVRRALALLASCTVALVGIGALHTVACMSEEGVSLGGMATDAPGPWQPRITRQQPLVTYDELKELESAGVAGEIFARFFDRDGQPCLTSLDRRIVALDLGQLRDVPLVVGVASGKHKAAAILVLAHGGWSGMAWVVRRGRYETSHLWPFPIMPPDSALGPAPRCPARAARRHESK